jgi:hypothetical protein
MHILQKLTHFLQVNFELLLYINLLFLICAVAVMISLKINEITARGFRSFLKGFIFYALVAAQIVIIFLGAYAYWLNYVTSLPIPIEKKLLPDTSWVKSDKTIYYISQNTLQTIGPDGLNQEYLLEVDDSIREYQFSPDKKWVLVIMDSGLALFNKKTRKTEIIETFKDIVNKEGYKGVIDNARWSPDSQRFCYRVSIWTSFSSRDSYFIYDTQQNQKRTFTIPLGKVRNLYWDRSGRNLYYFQERAMDTEIHSYSFEVMVFKVPLDTLVPERVTVISSKKKYSSEDRSLISKFDLFLDNKNAVFSRIPSDQFVWISPKGARLGIDQKDRLYYQKYQWWRERLFVVPRIPLPGGQFHPKGGELAIRQLRWLPGGRYVVLNHGTLGVLILEPETGKVGQLTIWDGTGFGWE